MPKIQVIASPIFLATVMSRLDVSGRYLVRQLAIPFIQSDDDPDLIEAWESGLLETLKTDIRTLNKLFRKNGLGRREIVIEEDEALAALRAISGIRLKLREIFLKRISNETLESGEIDMDKLDRNEQKNFASYLFFAQVQEELVEQM